MPTLNVDLRDVPAKLEDGVFACRILVDGKEYLGSMHHGPRPTFGDTRSCEVHVIDNVIGQPPATISIEAIAFLRPVATFPSPEALTKQMMEDIAQTRDILGA